MSKYMKVLYGTKSSAGGFDYVIGKVNEATNWNPSLNNPEDFGGFNFSTEDKILRWLLRGDTLYDVFIPKDAEIVECENKNTPHGVFRSNKIILTNPRKLSKEIVADLYLKSDLPDNTYFQCLTFLSLKNYQEVCDKIITDKVNKNNVDQALETFTTFFEVGEEYRNACYEKVLKKLKEISENKGGKL